MDMMDKTSEAKAAIAAQAELEEELKKRRRQEQLEQNNFIQSHITHTAKEEKRRREEEMYEEERERQAEEDDSALRQEQEEKRRREAEEEKKADEEADAAIDMLGDINGELDAEACRKLIDDLCSGKKTLKAKKEEKPKATEKGEGEAVAEDAPEQGEEMSIVEVKEIPRDVRAMMIGNTLRNFCRFAASESPLSNKHAEVGRLCASIMRRAAKEGITWDEMGLNPEEWTAVQGTVQLGEIVKKGLEAKAALSNPAYSGINRSEHLRNYLVFRGVEQMVAPHAEKYGADIQIGESHYSSAQILLGSPGFSARNLNRMVGESPALYRFETMKLQKVQELVSRGSAELDALGAQAMAVCYDNGMQSAKEPQETQMQKNREVQKGGVLKK